MSNFFCCKFSCPLMGEKSRLEVVVAVEVARVVVVVMVGTVQIVGIVVAYMMKLVVVVEMFVAFEVGNNFPDLEKDFETEIVGLKIRWVSLRCY